MLASLGAHVIQADAIAHELMQPGQAVYKEVVQRFGAEILNPDGTVNRARLARAGFGNPEAGIPSRIEELNKIVHPAVIKRQDRWMEDVGRREPGAVTVVEAALILEAGAAERFDRLIVVTCRPEQRVTRWAKRMKIDEESARDELSRRIAAQLPDEKKIDAADYVIDNSGSLDETRQQVNVLFTRLRDEAVQRVSR
jgi:dephospho-CoA kinase